MKLYGEVFPVEIIHPYLADCKMIMTAGEGMKDFCKVLYSRPLNSHLSSDIQ